MLSGGVSYYRMTKMPVRPRDPNRLAKMITDIATRNEAKKRSRH